MNGFGGWFRQLTAQLTARLRNFMAGRYGTDRLNMAILCVGLVASLLSVMIKFAPVNLVLFVLSYGMMFWAIFRTLSRNTYRRYRENRRFLMLLERIKDREHKHFDCPKCHQPVRVPRGKGKITVSCRGCGATFQEKS